MVLKPENELAPRGGWIYKRKRLNITIDQRGQKGKPRVSRKPKVLFVRLASGPQKYVKQVLGGGYRYFSAWDYPSGLVYATDLQPSLIIAGGRCTDGETIRALGDFAEYCDAPALIAMSSNVFPAERESLLNAGAAAVEDIRCDSLFRAVARALIRRYGWAPPASKGELSGVLEFPGLRYDLDRHQLLLEGNYLYLTPTESKLLVALLKRAPGLVSYQDLVRSVYGPATIVSALEDPEVKNVKVYVRYLRRKIGFERIENMIHRGYRFTAEPLTVSSEQVERTLVATA